MDDQETTLKTMNRRQPEENPLLKKQSRKKTAKSEDEKRVYKLNVLKIILVLLVIILIAALFWEIGFQNGALQQ